MQYDILCFFCFSFIFLISCKGSICDEGMGLRALHGLGQGQQYSWTSVSFTLVCYFICLCTRNCLMLSCFCFLFFWFSFRYSNSNDYQNVPRFINQSSQVSETNNDDPDQDLEIRIEANFYVGPAKAQFLPYPLFYFILFNLNNCTMFFICCIFNNIVETRIRYS